MDFPTSQPDVGLVGGVFVDENPATGQPGSRIPASWGNQVTLELKALIESAGLEPSDTENDQVLRALQLIVERIAGGMGSLPLFMNGWHDGTRAGLLLAYGGRATPQDGIQLSALTHPHIVKGVLAGHVASCTEAEWLADAYKRGMWSRGTAYLDAQGMPQGWVRGPDRNGVQEGSLPAQFWRGGADAKAGSIGKDTMRRLQGVVPNVIASTSLPEGVFEVEVTANANVTVGGGQRNYTSVRFDSSLGLPEGHTGGEFAPWHVFGCYYTITSNGVVNEGAIDAEQVMGEVLLNRGRINVLESNLPTKGSNGDGTAHWQIIDGVITQWGYTDAGVGGDGVRTITFPIPFPEKVTGVSVTRQLNSVGSDSWGVVVGMPTATSMVIGAAYSSGVPDTARLFWEVKGR